MAGVRKPLTKADLRRNQAERVGSADSARSRSGDLTAGFDPQETSSKTLFDDLVGLRQQQLRHGDTERLYGLQVDLQLEADRLNDQEIGRLGAFEDPAGVDADVWADMSWSARINSRKSGRINGRKDSPHLLVSKA
jgi:hypothetical protein